LGVAHVTLPRGHEERDLALAGRIASELGLAELHVFWHERRPRASAARRLPEGDPLGLLQFIGVVAQELGKRLQR
jgi:hypothetical protein